LIRERNDGMSDESKKRSRARIGWALVATFVAYPLSEGPASWVFQHHGGAGMADALNTVYAPCHWCAEKSSVTDEWHDAYILFWLTH
jgi:hypothetical protein